MSLQALVSEAGNPLDGKNVDLAVDPAGRVKLAPSKTWGASTVTTAPAGAALGGVTNYGGGVLIKNTDAAISVYLAPSLAELATDATRYLLAPGELVVIPVASLAAIFAASVSGAPLLTLIGAS